MKYKLIALDMDGTLLDEHQLIPIENKVILHKLYDMGIHIVIATGRTYSHAMLALGDLDIPFLLVSNNGNSVWDPVKGKRLSAKHIDPFLFHGIVEYGSQMQLHPIVHVSHEEAGFDFLISEDPGHPSYKSYLDSGTANYRRVKDFSGLSDPQAMMICFLDELSKLKLMEDGLQLRYPARIHTHIALNFKKIGPLLEIASHDGTKWDTVLQYGHSLGIRADEIIAIGDDNNDIPMLTHAGLGIAMANASVEAQKNASMVSPYSNKEAGVGRILAEIYNLSFK